MSSQQRSVSQSLRQIKTNVADRLGVDVASVRIDDLGCVTVRIDMIAPSVWQHCQDPSYGVRRAINEQVSVIDGRDVPHLPDTSIEIYFGQLFPEHCGPRTLEND